MIYNIIWVVIYTCIKLSFNVTAGQQIKYLRLGTFTEEKFVLNIDNKHCTCMKWSIIEIPCCHVVAAIKFLNLSEQDFIPHWFRISTYKEIYNSIIYPCNGQHLWIETKFPNVLPLPKRILPRRPKKKRSLEAWDKNKNVKQITKHGLAKKCGICKEIGQIEKVVLNNLSLHHQHKQLNQLI